jgi:hypothetical protein
LDGRDAGPPIDFFSLSGLRFLDREFSFRSGLGPYLGFIPVFFRREIILNLDFGGRVRIGAAVDFRVDQCERHFGHASGITVARARKDHILHARPTQRLGRLLAEHPRNRVGNVRLAAAVRPDDGGDAFAVEFQLGAITEGLESQNLQLFEFEQSDSSVPGYASGR